LLPFAVPWTLSHHSPPPPPMVGRWSSVDFITALDIEMIPAATGALCR